MTASSLHLPTFLFATLICHVIVGLQLLLAQRHIRSRNGLSLWVAGVWVNIAAQALVIAQAQLPATLGPVLANAAFCASLVLLAEALARFLNCPGPALRRRSLHALALLGTLLAALLPPSLRVPLTALLLLLPCALALGLMWQQRRRAERALQFVALALLLLAFTLLARGLEALLLAGAEAGLDAGHWVRNLSFLALFVLLIGGSFGFLLAVLQRSNARLERLARIDPLTHCLNRRAAEQLIDHSLRRARRERSPLALLLIDLDHFKRINDQHGHLAGDQMLRGFCQTARRQLRDSDVLARMGGEEFAVLLPMTGPEGAQSVAEHLRRATEALRLRDDQGREMPITVSIGVACLPAGGVASAESLYGLADRALYGAKRAGRNSVQACVVQPDATAERSNGHTPPSRRDAALPA